MNRRLDSPMTAGHDPSLWVATVWTLVSGGHLEHGTGFSRELSSAYYLWQ
jgi:hypothetical protein